MAAGCRMWDFITTCFLVQELNVIDNEQIILIGDIFISISCSISSSFKKSFVKLYFTIMKVSWNVCHANNTLTISRVHDRERQGRGFEQKYMSGNFMCMAKHLIQFGFDDKQWPKY